MSRILNVLKQHDISTTVGELITIIESNETLEKQKEDQQVNHIRSKFEDSYVKFTGEKSVFGKTLNVYYIKQITSHFKYEDWSIGYNIKGDRIIFSDRNINYKELKSNTTYDSLSHEYLDKAIKISKEEYDVYKKQYDNIHSTLKKLTK